MRPASTDAGLTATNWAGNYSYRAAKLHRPPNIEQVQEVIAKAPRLRVLGSRHSFTDIADSTELLSLDRLPSDVVVDRSTNTVSFSAALRYGELAVRLESENVALANLSSLPHISVAGAVATATHGSGDANGNLATAVAGLEMVTSSGEILRASRDDADFNGLVVGLGALGAVTRITLDVEPVYQVRQRVFERLAWEALEEDFDAITSSGYSVSLFTSWRTWIDQVWVKSRVTDAPEREHAAFFGAAPAIVERHPILGLDPVHCTQQLGVPGLWSDRLPHFRMGFTPSSGRELQSEYIVPRQCTADALREVRSLSDVIRPLLQISEIRTIAADDLWMSPQYAQDTIAIHFTWLPKQRLVERAIAAIESALAPFGARPHWGKLFLANAAAIAPLYERLPDFEKLVARLDPREAFCNDWLRQRVLGDR